MRYSLKGGAYFILSINGVALIRGQCLFEVRRLLEETLNVFILIKSILCKNNQAEKHEKKEKKKNVLKAEKYLIRKL